MSYRDRRLRMKNTDHRIDDLLLAGGGYTICAEDGTETEYASLAPKVGTVVTLRGKYRCSRCGEVCGELEDWQVDGEQVVCFTGKEFAWSAFRHQVVGFTVRTLLTPDYGSPPMTMCPTHGPLDVTAEGLRRDAVRSVDVELGQARGKATRNVKMAPLHAEWDGVPERSQ